MCNRNKTAERSLPWKKTPTKPSPYFLQHVLEKFYLNQHIIQRLLTLCPLMETK